MYTPKSQRPYIGITDFMSNEQVRLMLEMFRRSRQPNSVRRLHVGVMMSFNTLYACETKWSMAFPTRENVVDIFQPVDDTRSDKYRDLIDDIMFTLHYVDYHDRPTLFQDLMLALQYSGPFVDALQLDMTWPDPAAISNALHASRKNLEIILQIGTRAFDLADNDPDRVVENLYPYQTFVTHVLLDKSMGKGLGMDAEGLLPFARAIRKEYPNMGIVVAGGLGPNTICLAEPFLDEFPDISIDAQGRLRPSGNLMDPIDWEMAGEYLTKALIMFR